MSAEKEDKTVQQEREVGKNQAQKFKTAAKYSFSPIVLLLNLLADHPVLVHKYIGHLYVVKFADAIAHVSEVVADNGHIHSRAPAQLVSNAHDQDYKDKGKGKDSHCLCNLFFSRLSLTTPSHHTPQDKYFYYYYY